MTDAEKMPRYRWYHSVSMHIISGLRYGDRSETISEHLYEPANDRCDTLLRDSKALRRNPEISAISVFVFPVAGIMSIKKRTIGWDGL